jgi:dipeptidyl aminopeptidase/acylaminoacyl peptidase
MIARATRACITAGCLAAVAFPSRIVRSQSPLHAMHHDSLSAPGNPRKHVEYFWIVPEGTGPWPAIVLIHGYQEGRDTPGGKAFVDYGALDTLAAHGYVAIAVSQPGFGHSDGPPDFMGPETVNAVQSVIRYFRAQSFVRADRIGLEGVSRGAVVASLVAVQDSTIRAMVLISGAYDFLSPLDSSTAAGRLNIARRNQVRADIASETDGSAGALRARSALFEANKIRTPALLLNGEQDDRTDPEQARVLAELILRNGVYARSMTYPEFGHAIPLATRELVIRPFFQAYLK